MIPIVRSCRPAHRCIPDSVSTNDPIRTFIRSNEGTLSGLAQIAVAVVETVLLLIASGNDDIGDAGTGVSLNQLPDVIHNHIIPPDPKHISTLSSPGKGTGFHNAEKFPSLFPVYIGLLFSLPYALTYACGLICFRQICLPLIAVIFLGSHIHFILSRDRIIPRPGMLIRINRTVDRCQPCGTGRLIGQ